MTKPGVSQGSSQWGGQQRGQAQGAQVKQRVLSFLQQYPHQPLTTYDIEQGTQVPQEVLKGVLGELAKNGQSSQLRRVSKDAYLFSLAPLPQMGQRFTGEVIGTTFSGASIIRDASGATWKIEAIV